MSETRFVTALRDAIEASQTSAYQVGIKAHGTHGTIHHWLSGARSSPGMDNFEAALNVLGLTLKIVPLEEKQ